MASNSNENSNANVSNSDHSNEITFQLNRVNDKLDYIVTNLNQKYSFSKKCESASLESNHNIHLSLNMYKA